MKWNFNNHICHILSGLFCMLLVFSSCKDGENTAKSIEEIQADGQISSIIRSPISAAGPTDTVNVAKMVFDEVVHDFGEVKEGDLVKHTFTFTNTGKVPLVISDAHSTCGCTVPQWPKKPVLPGASDKIEVEFNTKSKPRNQEKSITINANTYPSVTKVILKGYVHPNEEE